MLRFHTAVRRHSERFWSCEGTSRRPVNSRGPRFLFRPQGSICANCAGESAVFFLHFRPQINCWLKMRFSHIFAPSSRSEGKSLVNQRSRKGPVIVYDIGTSNRGGSFSCHLLLLLGRLLLLLRRLLPLRRLLLLLRWDFLLVVPSRLTKVVERSWLS